MSAILTVVVHGHPAAQGSKRHVGGGRLIEQSKAVTPWREAVKTATLTAIADQHYTPAPDRTPLALTVVVTLGRPASHWRTGANAGRLRHYAPAWPVTGIDVDKALRGVADALSDAGAYPNDARIVHATITKTYPGGHLDALEHPGAVITLQEAG